MRYVTREEMQELDRTAIEEYHIPSIVLMENAGAGATRAMREKIAKGPVLVLCGKGNNGGDGFVIARHLYNAGIAVEVFFVGEIAKIAATSDPGINLAILQKMGIIPHEIDSAASLAQHQAIIDEAEVVVDALFGTGLSGTVREREQQIIRLVASWGKPVFAVDIPSGLDANTGDVLGAALPAVLTTTFALPKRGFRENKGPEYVGELVVIDISIPRDILEETK